MSLLTGWRGWRRFSKLPSKWQHIVVYSESGQDWHHFSGLIEQLNTVHGERVCYVTSDPGDPGLGRRHEYFLALHIPAGWFLTVFFQVNHANVFVLTMMDLHNLQLKRSLHPVHYIYLFHSMGSTHMVDNENSFDHYDTLFCACRHQVEEIRRREALKKLPQKRLFDYGHPRLEEVISLGQTGSALPLSATNNSATAGRVAPPSVLIAPTWGEDSIFNCCGETLIRVLLEAGLRVVMRPHYQSTWQSPEVIAGLRAFRGPAGFQLHR